MRMATMVHGRMNFAFSKCGVPSVQTLRVASRDQREVLYICIVAQGRTHTSARDT